MNAARIGSVEPLLATIHVHRAPFIEVLLQGRAKDMHVHVDDGAQALAPRVLQIACEEIAVACGVIHRAVEIRMGVQELLGIEADFPPACRHGERLVLRLEIALERGDSKMSW